MWDLEWRSFQQSYRISFSIGQLESINISSLWTILNIIIPILAKLSIVCVSFQCLTKADALTITLSFCFEIYLCQNIINQKCKDRNLNPFDIDKCINDYFNIKSDQPIQILWAVLKYHKFSKLVKQNQKSRLQKNINYFGDFYFIRCLRFLIKFILLFIIFALVNNLNINFHNKW